MHAGGLGDYDDKDCILIMVSRIIIGQTFSLFVIFTSP